MKNFLSRFIDQLFEIRSGDVYENGPVRVEVDAVWNGKVVFSWEGKTISRTQGSKTEEDFRRMIERGEYRRTRRGRRTN